MSITVDSIIPFLLARGLIDRADIVDGNVEAVDETRRNANIRVTRSGGPGYLLKQPGVGEEMTEETLRVEADFYRLCETDPHAAAMREVVPRMFGFDEQEQVLTLELLDGATPLWTYYGRSVPPAFPADSGRGFGRALGVLHRTFRRPGLGDELRIPGPRDSMPWVFLAHRPGPEALSRSSPAHIQTIKILQREANLASHLDRLRRIWTPDTLVHNDIKSDNVLVIQTDRGAPPVIRIVDWELSQIGDAAWDIGAAFADYLIFWLISVPVAASMQPEEEVAGAGFPLATMYSCIRGFWQAYRAAAAPPDAGALLERAVQYCAAKLIQSAHDTAHGTYMLSGHSVAMLQLSANILSDPAAAALHLLGLPPTWRVSHYAHAGA